MEFDAGTSIFLSALETAIGRRLVEAVSGVVRPSGLALGDRPRWQDETGLRKGRDGRAPAGIFRIGKIYTYDAQLPPGADYPFHQVTTADAWVDDVKHPDYNRFVTIDDPQIHLLVSEAKNASQRFCLPLAGRIRHNSDPPVPGGGRDFSTFVAASTDRPLVAPMAEAESGANDPWLPALAPLLCPVAGKGYEDKEKAWGLPILPHS